MMHSGFGNQFSHWGSWFCGPGAFFPGPLGWIVTLLFWAMVIYLVVILFRALFAKTGKTPGDHLNALKERYARGEISEAEYTRMKTELS